MTKEMNAVNAKLPTGVSIPGKIEHDVPISVDVAISIPNMHKKSENTNTHLAVSKVHPSTDSTCSRNEQNASNSDLGRRADPPRMPNPHLME
jgi:hypothetical protein